MKSRGDCKAALMLSGKGEKTIRRARKALLILLPLTILENNTWNVLRIPIRNSYRLHCPRAAWPGRTFCPEYEGMTALLVVAPGNTSLVPRKEVQNHKTDVDQWVMKES